MTALGDFAIVHGGSAAGAPGGKWKSAPFEAGGRLLRYVGGVEQANAYVAVTVSSPTGGHYAEVKVLVNGHALSEVIAVTAASKQTAAIPFLASYLSTGSNNIIDLQSAGGVYFNVFGVICHFRQNS